MPMKFGSSLTSKLGKVDANQKHYWEKPGLEKLPFLLAIADFHRDADVQRFGSMTYTQSALPTYLYGCRVTGKLIDGKATFNHERVEEHRYREKSIPSGFFYLPDAENVSAVVFSNAGTIAKFDRIGFLAGYGEEGVRCIRQGTVYDPDPDALSGIPFKIDVNDPSYAERWADEIQVFHNPRAKIPLDPETFPGAAHIFFENGEFSIQERPYRVLNSTTMHLHSSKTSQMSET